MGNGADVVQSCAKPYKSGRSLSAVSEGASESALRVTSEANASLKTSTMRPTIIPVVFAAALLFEGCCAGLPLGKSEDGSFEQEALASLLADDRQESNFADVEPAAGGKTRTQRVIVVADPGMWRDLRALHGGLSLLQKRAEDHDQVVDHRGASQDLNIPILRRDTMRCMVGRVYRPCWEV